MNKNFSLKKIFFFFIIIVFLQTFSNIANAVDPDEILNNKEQELRARNISKNIRCMVCQNQSIDESSAPLAKDLRILIRDKIKKGNTDKEVYKFLTDRYGDFILLKPSFSLQTFALWVFPFLFFLLGTFIIYRHNKRSKDF
jgi:cytochrome c-type biogenesis protein CcmH